MTNVTNITETVPFQFYIQTIGRGAKRRRSLTQAEAKNAMAMILKGKVTDMQLGAFLMLIRVREETSEEAAGFVEAIRESFQPQVPDKIKVDVDWGSYAGKRRTLPWFLLSIQLLVDAGYKVLLHGIVGSDEGRLYSESFMDTLWWPVASDLAEAAQNIEQRGVCYLPIENYAPPVKTLMDNRAELGLRSPVHTVARMLNPLNAGLSVHGVFHKGYDDLHQLVAQRLSVDNDSQSVLAFCGDAGEAEVRPDRKTVIKCVSNGQATEFDMPKTFVNVDPTQKSVNPDDLLALWRGEIEHEYGEASVLQTLAMVLVKLEGLTIEQAWARAESLWLAR